MDHVAALLTRHFPGSDRELRVGDVVLHRRRLRREDRQVAAALAHHAQLVLLDRLADLVVCDLGRRGALAPELLPAVALVRVGHGRVVTVAVDDHS